MNVSQKVGAVFESKDGKVFGWRGRKNYFLQTVNRTVAQRINGWSFSRLAACGVNTFLQIFRIPLGKWQWACAALGLPLPAKSEGRVKQGQKLGGKAPKISLGAQVHFRQRL